MKWRILLLLTLVGTSGVSRADYYTFTGSIFPLAQPRWGSTTPAILSGAWPSFAGSSIRHGALSTFAVPGECQHRPAGINNVGQIVGTYFTDTLHGFVYKDGAFTTVDFPGADATLGTWLTSINDIEQIVGLYATTPVAPNRSRSQQLRLVVLSWISLNLTMPVNVFALSIAARFVPRTKLSLARIARLRAVSTYSAPGPGSPGCLG